MEIHDRSTLQQYVDNTPDSYLMPLLAALYLADDNTRTAITVCQQDLTIHPHSSIAHFIWALSAEAQNDIDQAVAHFQKVIQTDTCFLQAYYKLVEYSQGYLTPQQLKHCYEQICRLNPFDAETAAKLAALPADLDILAVQMKVKPQRPQKAAPAIKTEPAAIQLDAEQSVPVSSEPEPFQPLQEPAIEADLANGAEHLAKFFDSLNQAAEPENQPVVASKPEIPEEEAHFGPMEMMEPNEPPVGNEPEVIFDEPEPVRSPAAVSSEPAGSSSISDLFSRLREKPLEEVEKENWMAERAMANIPAEPPAPAKEESPLPPGPQVEEAPVMPTVDILAGKLENLLTSEPVAPPSEPIPEKPAVAETPIETVSMDNLPAETTETAEETVKPSVPKKRPARQTKKTTGTANNISFPIPTWTLVDVLTKQKLFEQALSILDIIEAKSKNEKDLEKVQASRAEIVRRMAEEQSGEA